MGRLYVVATPIGNLEDLSPRARRVLSEVSLVAAEDTRSARVLLSSFGGRARLLSYNEHNREARIPRILDELQRGDVALVSDAGTPAVSDPGVELVAAARAAGHEVVAVPGPSAVAAALSVAGLPCARFHFAGFLPRSSGGLRRFLQEPSANGEAVVAFESPQRLRATLQVTAEAAPRRRLAVCRELTKLHEEVFVGTAAEALAHFPPIVRGEIVLVLEPRKEASESLEEGADLAGRVAEMRRLGLSRAQATALLASLFGVPRRRAYELWLASDAGASAADPEYATTSARKRGSVR